MTGRQVREFLLSVAAGVVVLVLCGLALYASWVIA